MAVRLTLVCQAATRALRAATFNGDDALDETGRRGAETLRRALGPVGRCWTSPNRPAVETAEALGLVPIIEARLRDCDYGRWTGLTFQQVLLREPRKLVRWIRDPGTAPHGGETIPEVLARVAEWMGDPALLEGHAVAVAPAAVIRAAISHVIRAGAASFWRIDVTPLSRTDIRTNGRRWVLRAIMPPDGTQG